MHPPEAELPKLTRQELLRARAEGLDSARHGTPDDFQREVHFWERVFADYWAGAQESAAETALEGDHLPSAFSFNEDGEIEVVPFSQVLQDQAEALSEAYTQGGIEAYLYEEYFWRQVIQNHPEYRDAQPPADLKP